jgi:hypothetical protein
VHFTGCGLQSVIRVNDLNLTCHNLSEFHAGLLSSSSTRSSNSWMPCWAAQWAQQ